MTRCAAAGLLMTGAVLAAPPGGATTHAAAGARQTPIFSSRVEIVRVDVLVTDDGHPVAGLGPDDFEVRDNGVRQDISILRLEEIPLNVMLTVDMSASVDGVRLDNLRAAARALLDGLRPDDRAGFIAFNHVVSRVRDVTSSIDDVRAALDQVTPSGATSLIDATYASLTVTDSNLRRGLVVVFSDGLDTSSWLTEEQVVESARRSESIVYAVAVAQRRGSPAFLREISDATGGRLLELDQTDDLPAVFVSVLNEFRQRYLLSYSPRGVDTAGWHALEVRVRRRGADVRARSGYVR